MSRENPLTAPKVQSATDLAVAFGDVGKGTVARFKSDQGVFFGVDLDSFDKSVD